VIASLGKVRRPLEAPQPRSPIPALIADQPTLFPDHQLVPLRREHAFARKGATQTRDWVWGMALLQQQVRLKTSLEYIRRTLTPIPRSILASSGSTTM
jgi:hypothetical protein